jgi:hypothetical protein
LSYQWKAGGTNVGTNASTYTVATADLGKAITVVITSSVETGNVTSAATSAVVKKAAPAAPAAPTLSSRTDTSVTLVATAGREYSKDGTTWQTSNVFTGLFSGTAYTFYQRIAETADTLPSASSPVFNVTTLTPVTFTAVQTGGTSNTVNSTGIVLTFSTAVTGLTADNITVTNGTGAAVKGTLSGSGTTWTIALSSVTTQGNVTVSVTNFGNFNVTTVSQTVAVYKDTTTKYTVTVSGGTANKTTAVVGDTVTITANAPTSSFLTSQSFKEWTGASVSFANKNSATTTFIMPAQNVTVTATYDSMIRLWGKTTKYASNFLNWLLCIVCFGWIWMAF